MAILRKKGTLGNQWQSWINSHRLLYLMQTFPLMNCQWHIFDRAESTKLEGHEQHSLAEEVLAD